MVDLCVCDGGLDGESINIDANGAACAEQQTGDGQNTAAAAHIKHGIARLYILFEQLHAKAGRFMRAGTERETRLQMQHDAVTCFVLVLPHGAHKQAVADGDGLKILFPVVDPILLRTVGGGDGVLNADGFKTLFEERNGFRRVFLRADIHMDDAFGAVFFEKVFVDEVDMRDLHRFLF